MRKIILLVKNLNLKNDAMGKLYNMSVSFLEGYVYSLSGMDYSGRDIFLNIISGEESHKMYEGSFYINDKCTNSVKELKDSLYTFSLNNETIKNWTVYEYICLREGKWLLNRKNNDEMRKKVVESLCDFGLEILEDTKIGQLSEFKKYQIELVRAKILNRKIIIIKDEFEGMKNEEIKEFSGWLKANIKNDMTVILNTYSKLASYECADIFICFKKGCIIKMCKKNGLKNIDELDDFVVGNSMNEKINNLNVLNNSRLKIGTDEIYSIKGNILGRGIENLSFSKGKIYSFIISSHRHRYKFFKHISGIDNKNIKYFIDRYEQKVAKLQDLIDKKIISADKIGDKDYLAENMSVEDNLLLPSLNKISSLNYITSKQELGKSVFEELKSMNIKNRSCKATGYESKNLYIIGEVDYFQAKSIYYIRTFCTL